MVPASKPVYSIIKFRAMLLKNKLYILVPVVTSLVIIISFLLISKEFKIGSTLEEDLKGPPPVEFKLSNGKKTTLEELKGRAILLNFWATWCEPCMQEMPSLRALEKHYKNRGLMVLAINIQETPYEELQDKLEGISTPENLIFNVKRSQIAAYNIEGIPYSILIDKSGNPKQTFEGPRMWHSPEVIAQIDQLLKEQ